MYVHCKKGLVVVYKAPFRRKIAGASASQLVDLGLIPM